METAPGVSQPATPLTSRASFGAGALTLTPGRSGRHSRGASMDLRAAAAALARQDSVAGSMSGSGLGLGSALSSPVPGRTPRHSRTRSIEAAAALAGEPARPAYRTTVRYGAQNGLPFALYYLLPCLMGNDLATACHGFSIGILTAGVDLCARRSGSAKGMYQKGL